MSEWKRLGSVVVCQIHTDRMVLDGVYRDHLITEVDALCYIVGLATATEPVDIAVGDEFWVRA